MCADGKTQSMMGKLASHLNKEVIGSEVVW